MTFEWFRIYYRKRREVDLVKFSFNQINSFLKRLSLKMIQDIKITPLKIIEDNRGKSNAYVKKRQQYFF